MHRSTVMALAICLMATSTAAAQGGGLQNSLLAETLFKDGQELMKAGKFDEACSKFAGSYKLDPAAGTLLNLANCQEKNGKLATAWIAYTEAAALNAKAGNKDREKFARGKAEALQPRLNRIRVQVPFPSAGQEIRLDGNPVPMEVWNSAMPLDAGAHKLEATAPGKAPWSATVTIVSTTPVEVVAVPELKPLAVAKPAPPPEPVKVVEARKVEDPVVAPPPMMPVARATVTKMSSGRIAGIAIGGVGVAGVAAGIGLLASAKGIANERDALCAPGGGYCYSQEAFNKDHDARVMQQWGLVAGGVGLAAVGIGVILAVMQGDVRVDPDDQESQEKNKKQPENSDEFSLNFGPTNNGNGFQVVMGGVW